MDLSELATNDWTKLLPRLPEDVLRRIAATYGGTDCRGRDASLQYMLGLLENPEAMARAVAALPLRDRRVLATFRSRHGLAVGFEAGLTMAACGLREGHPLDDRDPTGAFVRSLAERGLLVEYDPLQALGFRSPSPMVCVDPRVLAHTGDSACLPIELEAVCPPDDSRLRPPHEVLFMLEDVLRQVSVRGGLALTEARPMRAADRRRLISGLGWESLSDLGALPFPDLAEVLVSALCYEGSLEAGGAKLRVAGDRGPMPTAVWVRRLASAFAAARTPPACEGLAQESLEDPWAIPLRLSRSAFLNALAALDDPCAFHSVDDFSRALFDRIGPDYLSTYLGPGSERGGRLPTGAQRDRVLWEGWLQREHVVIERGLGTWLHALGVVEVGVRDGRVVAFRLTDFGRVAMTGAARRETPAASEPAWVVQPNLEVVVWMDRAEVDQLALLEAFADRGRVRDHTMHYTLSRRSVHGGLDRGGTAEQLLEGLAAGSQAPVPQNVAAEIREWTQVRDRVVLRRGANLLQFVTAADRDAALRRGITGEAVGAVFLLLPDTPPTLAAIAAALPTRSMDFCRYGSVPDRSVRVYSDGSARVGARDYDLQTEGLMERWFDRRPDGLWQLTETGVKRAIAAGAPSAELDALLARRTSFRVPGPLQIAVRGWSGRKSQMGLETCFIIRCRNARERDMLLEDRTVVECAVGPLQDDAILVTGENLPRVLDRLKWAGVEVVQEPS